MHAISDAQTCIHSSWMLISVYVSYNGSTHFKIHTCEFKESQSAVSNLGINAVLKNSASLVAPLINFASYASTSIISLYHF